MPLFVVIIALLSFLSFLYSVKVFNQESLRLQMASSSFGGNIQHKLEHVFRLCMATLVTGTSALSVLLSIALIWLSFQPSLVG